MAGFSAQLGGGALMGKILGAGSKVFKHKPMKFKGEYGVPLATLHE